MPVDGVIVDDRSSPWAVCDTFTLICYDAAACCGVSSDSGGYVLRSTRHVVLWCRCNRFVAAVLELENSRLVENIEK